MTVLISRYPHKQPATRFRDPHLPFPEAEQWIDLKPRALRTCDICGNLRQCRHLNVQVAYDRHRWTCSDQDCTPKPRQRSRCRRL